MSMSDLSHLRVLFFTIIINLKLCLKIITFQLLSFGVIN